MSNNLKIAAIGAAAFLLYEIVLAANGGRWIKEAPPAPTPEPTPVTTPDASSTQPTAASTEPAPADPNAASTTPTAASTTAAPADAPAAGPLSDSDKATAEKDIQEMLQAWNQAMVDKDADKLFAFYHPDFTPTYGGNRQGWEALRRKRMSSPGEVKSKITSVILFVVDANRATATFQHTEGTGAKDTTAKSLKLAKRDGKWLIQEERVVY